jgi:hypothetical protein
MATMLSWLGIASEKGVLHPQPPDLRFVPRTFGCDNRRYRGILAQRAVPSQIFLGSSCSSDETFLEDDRQTLHDHQVVPCEELWEAPERYYLDM